MKSLAALLFAAALAFAAGDFPDPSVDVKPTPGKPQKAIFAGGCFWCTEAVFEQIEGVTNVVSGYSGGKKETATYQQVGSGTTGHAEAIEITYDSTKVTYGQLLKIFFSVAHDPTQLNRQGPDRGASYRSEIFAATPAQLATAKAYIAQLEAARIFPARIVTKNSALKGFY